MEYFLGAVVALLVQLSKRYLGTTKNGTKLLVIVLSAGGALAWYAIIRAGYAESLIKILTTAGAMHNFIIREFENSSGTIPSVQG